jgi:hypothetical protein
MSMVSRDCQLGWSVGMSVETVSKNGPKGGMKV